MTFNIRHALGLDERIDLERVIAVIAQSYPDVVALQEVDRYMSRSGHVDQAAELARALQMDWRYAASLRHGHSEYGNAILSRYRVVDDEVIFFPGEKERRSLLEVKLDTPMGIISVMTTHLGVTERDRMRQLPLLIGQLAKVETQAILMGDFNMESDHSLMKGIGGLGWREVELADPGSGTVIGGGTIDHIFTHDVGNGYKAYTIATAASDHCPIVVEISRDMVYYDHINRSKKRQNGQVDS
ncbi:MAG: endonuclease/exonuclease/phosphatase family protein [Paenibacillaceae bacterium]